MRLNHSNIAFISSLHNHLRLILTYVAIMGFKYDDFIECVFKQVLSLTSAKKRHNIFRGFTHLSFAILVNR